MGGPWKEVAQPSVLLHTLKKLRFVVFVCVERVIKGFSCSDRKLADPTEYDMNDADFTTTETIDLGVPFAVKDEKEEANAAAGDNDNAQMDNGY
ncbi:MAG: hypothetical protein GY820_44580 [Gammaproteobacteria bacterium]|nr:hypothetical protein [Gammaproteobacteria bacterium]